MSGNTSIQWCDTTWNPVSGCTYESTGCLNCYARVLHDRRYLAWKRGRWPSAPAQYHQPFKRVQLLRDRLEDPLHWRNPRRVFVNSVSDLFHEDVPDVFIDAVFSIMERTPQHTYQVLTKRPLRMADFCQRMVRNVRPMLAHVWVGVSVENQQAADERIPPLLETPAAVRFLSCEPLLEPLDLSPWLTFASQFDKAEWCLAHYGCSQPLSWVIVGGESGKHARPMHRTWAESLWWQCEEAGVAFFMKQVGTVWAKAHHYHDPHGGDMSEWPDELRIRQFPRLGLCLEGGVEARHDES